MEEDRMSLLDEAFEKYTILNKIRVDDGYGGSEVTWVDGPDIYGAMVFNNSIEGKTAQAMGVTSVYTFTTRKNVVLDYHDVIKRDSDGKIFRVTSDGDDSFTPDSATLDMRQVSCEEWRLGNG
jgi:hypothetical protein